MESNDYRETATAQVTYQMVDLGWARYLYILALISINLAILNILPIPVLDGGQIALLTVEKLRGKPTPERAQERVRSSR